MRYIGWVSWWAAFVGALAWLTFGLVHGLYWTVTGVLLLDVAHPDQFWFGSLMVAVVTIGGLMVGAEGSHRPGGDDT